MTKPKKGKKNISLLQLEKCKPALECTGKCILEESTSRRCYESFTRRYSYSSGQKMPDCDFVPKKYNGPSYDTIERLKTKHMPPTISNIYRKPLLLHQGHMQFLFDHEGKRYLDLAGGIVTISVGHCHPKVVSVLREQTDTLWHSTNIYRHPKIYEYIEQLASKLPGDLKVVYLVNSGSEANDLATLLAKAYTGNNDIISLQSSYHGCSSGIMGLTATQSYRLPVPVPTGFYHAVLPDPYKGPWVGCRDSLSQPPDACTNCSGECVSTDKYIRQLEDLLNNSVPAGRVAALFAESIQGAGGVVQFPKGYIKKAQALIKKNGGLFISDEVQTGFGRTGDHYWGFESHGVIPDIVTMAKGIGNGFPLAAVVTTKEIAAKHNVVYFNTFGGNALAATVGKAVMDVIEEEKLQLNSKLVGTYFIEQLMQLQKLYPVVGDVRGQGLMLGLELVTPGTKQPLNAEKINDIHETVKDLGVLVIRGGRHYNVLRLKPPMCITKEDVDFTISVLDETLKIQKNK